MADAARGPARDCAACGYPTDGFWCCTWCFETVIAANAIHALGPHVVTDCDHEMAMLTADFILRATAQRREGAQPPAAPERGC